MTPEENKPDQQEESKPSSPSSAPTKRKQSVLVYLVVLFAAAFLRCPWGGAGRHWLGMDFRPFSGDTAPNTRQKNVLLSGGCMLY